jgi:biopolymer transport protein ExbB
MNLVETFQSGGPVMWPLLASALIAIAIAFERTIVLHRLPSAKACEKQLNAVEDVLIKGGLEAASKHVSKGKGILNYVFARLLKRFDTLITERRDLDQRRRELSGATLQAVDPVTKFLSSQSDIAEIREELFSTVDDAVKSYVGKFLAALNTVGSIATLMGLLGTITGMINAFNAIAASGTGDPKIVAAGIAEALITTATGLIIAIPSVIFYRYLSHKADMSRGGIELYAVSFSNTLIAMLEKIQQQEK